MSSGLKTRIALQPKPSATFTWSTFITVHFAGVNIFERELYAVIHIKGTLRLANQTQIGVIDQYMDVRNVELCANG